jgi:hypothetical protein
MSQSVAPTAQGDAERLEQTTDQAIAACGGDVRAALKAMFVANEFLESEVCECRPFRTPTFAEGSRRTPADEALKEEFT